MSAHNFVNSDKYIYTKGDFQTGADIINNVDLYDVIIDIRPMIYWIMDFSIIFF